MNNSIKELWQLIFTNQDPVGYAVNMFIAVLFLIGVIDILSALKRLASERLLIERARKKLNESPHCPAHSEEAVLGFFGAPKRTQLGSRIARVMRLRQAGLGQRETLQRLTAERIDGYGALARYIGVTLTLLGLLGTVFGLSFALLKIQGALEGLHDIEGLRLLTEALGGTLRGMKTAFGCTLAGLIGAIAISFLNHTVRRAQSRVTASLEEFVICELLPALEKVDPNADESAKAFANTLSSASTELNQVRETILAAAAEYRQGSQEMARVVEGLQAIMQSFSSSTSTLTGNQQAFTQTMSETRAAIGSLTEAVTGQFEDLRTFTASCNQVMGERLNVMEQSTKSNLSLQENLHALAQNFQPAVLEYHNHFKEFLNGTLAEFKATLTSLLHEVNQHYKDGVSGHVSGSLKAYQETLGMHKKDLEELVEHNHKALSEMFAGQNEALRAFSDMVLDVNMNFSTLSDRLSQTNGYSHAAVLPMKKEEDYETAAG